MKVIPAILSCALAAGLMAVATDKAQAASSIVISNVLYLPLTLKASATFTINGKSKKASLSTKTFIEQILQLSAGSQLAISGENGDVWALGPGGNEDLTTMGIMTVSIDQTGSTLKGSTETDVGSVGVSYYENPQFDIGGLNAGESEAASQNWFEFSGPYTLKQTQGAANTQGIFKLSDTFTAKSLNGNGYFSEAETNIVPISGSVSAKGSGSLQGP
jgi:hypothetical protein